MAGISSKAALSSLSAYKYNAGRELEDEGGLNYYNTFYRKYDAQIGRFTGVDVMAESFAGLTPFQFGNNNPVFFNDPMGDKFVQIKETAWSAPRQNDPHDYLTNDGWFDNIGNSWDRELETGGGGGSISIGDNLISFGGDMAKAIFKEMLAVFNSENSSIGFGVDGNGNLFTQVSTNINGFEVSDNAGNNIGTVFVSTLQTFNDGKAGGLKIQLDYDDNSSGTYRFKLGSRRDDKFKIFESNTK